MKEIKLTQGKIAIVDDSDFELINQYKWQFKPVLKSGYAHRTQRVKGTKLKLHIKMHRLIIDAKKEQIVDHINGNSLDNRRNNLRIGTLKQNAQNSKTPNTNKSGYKGVSWHKGASKWRVTIKSNQKQIHLGFYLDPKEAAIAYNKAAKEYFGDFARINEIVS